MIDWERRRLLRGDDDWLDGPRVAAWLEARGLLRGHGATHLGREIRRWAKTKAVNLYAADPTLIKLGVHYSELPDDAWTKPPRRRHGGSGYSQELREAAVEELRAGRSRHAVAKFYGIGTDTIRRWEEEAKWLEQVT